MPPSSPSPSLPALIADTLAIEAESAQTAGALGFLARAMVQATLPHKKVAGNEFERKNGAYTLHLLAPAKVGLPYGTVPRLLLAWLTTEAVRTQNRELFLGDSLSHFMHELDMVPTGGRWGSITRLKDQTARLFASTVSATYAGKQSHTEAGFRLADRSTLWWDAKAPEQAGLWESSVKLSETFFNEVIAHPIPVDMRAIRSLKKSPLALDIYAWMTYRASYATKPSEIPWQALAMQFGSDYAQVRDFKAAFLDALKKVLIVYPEARVSHGDFGLTLAPSRPHVRKPTKALPGPG